jgi:hypothetical protein
MTALTACVLVAVLIIYWTARLLPMIRKEDNNETY